MLVEVGLRQTQEDHGSNHQLLHESSALVSVLEHVVHVACSWLEWLCCSGVLLLVCCSGVLLLLGAAQKARHSSLARATMSIHGSVYTLVNRPHKKSCSSKSRVLQRSKDKKRLHLPASIQSEAK